MKKLRTGGLIAIICVIGMGIVLGARSAGTLAVSGSNETSARSGDTIATIPSATPDATSAQPTAVPDKIVYGIFFRQSATFSAKADEVEKNGGDGRALRRHFAQIAVLNDTDSDLLNRVLADYVREASLIEARQRAMVDAFHARYPDGHVPDGETRDRPASYQGLNLEREQLYLRMRDQLQTVLGPQTFARLDTALRSKITGNPQSIIGGPPPSAAQEVKP